jgi:hypothetical protein
VFIANLLCNPLVQHLFCILRTRSVCKLKWTEKIRKNWPCVPEPYCRDPSEPNCMMAEYAVAQLGSFMQQDCDALRGLPLVREMVDWRDWRSRRRRWDIFAYWFQIFLQPSCCLFVIIIPIRAIFWWLPMRTPLAWFINTQHNHSLRDTATFIVFTVLVVFSPRSLLHPGPPAQRRTAPRRWSLPPRPLARSRPALVNYDRIKRSFLVLEVVIL